MHRFREHLTSLSFMHPAHPSSQFVVCPTVLCHCASQQQFLFQQQLYRWAYEQAQAALAPQPLSLYEAPFSLN